MKRVQTRLKITVFFLVVFSCCTEEISVQQEQGPMPVRTVEVAVKETRVTVAASGVVANKNVMDLSFKIGGRIDQIAVQEGDRVVKGKLLAVLDQTEINARVDRARAAFDRAGQNLRIAEKLDADEAIPAQELLDAQNASKSARADLEIAEHSWKFSSIHAPAGGRILKKLAEANERVEAGQPMFVLAGSTTGLALRAGVTDRDILQVSLGDSAAVFFDVYPDRTVHAVVSKIAAGSNPRTGLYEVELTLVKEAVPLLHGMMGRAEIFTQQVEKLPGVPVEALVDADGDRGYVYVVEDERVFKRLISLGPIIGRDVLVARGLEAGETIVTEGAAYLQDSSVVKVVPPRTYGRTD